MSTEGTLSPLALQILLVEDHHDSAVALSSLLRSSGHAVQIAETIRSAKQLFNHQRFDLLLCDLGLPDGDGCNLLRDLQQNGPVRAIAITGFGMAEDIERSKAAGFLRHITKPLVVSQLQDLLTELSRTLG